MRVLWAILCLGFTWAAPAAASELVLESLVDVALVRHPAVLAAEASAQAAIARAGAARSPYWPQVGSNSSAARTTNISPSQTAAQPFLLSAVGIQVRQQVWDFGKTEQEALQADALAAALAYEVELAKAQAAFDVRRAYLDWSAARASSGAAQKNFEAASAVYRQSLAFWRSGRRPKIEALRAEADREGARAEVVNARVAVEVARRALSAALAMDDLPPGEPVFPRLPLDASRPLVDWLTHGLGRHPALRAAASRAEASAARAAGAARAGWPDLMADANYGIRARDELPGQLWSTGLSVSLPLFTGFAQTRNFEAARADAQAAAAAQQDRARSTRFQIEQAYMVLQGARERRPVFHTQLKAARETWRLALGRYQAGVGTLIEVADARALLLTAEAAEVRAEADLHRAMAELWRALGVTGRVSLSPANPAK